jgi:lipopolysaccharide export system protein LptA
LKILSLARHIELRSSDGKHAKLSKAQIETDSGHIISRKPVKVDFDRGDISANELEIVNSGELVRFVGSVVFKTRPAPSANTEANAHNGKNSSTSLLSAAGDPVRIESIILEVRDKDHLASFRDKVHVTKGDSTLKCETLVIEYQEGGVTASNEAGNNSQQIRHMEANGGVVRDQVATGDTATFDARENTGTLLGHVTLTQGENVTHGDRLVVDLTTGVSRVETLNGAHTRVKSVFSPRHDSENPVASTKGSRPRQTPSQPPQLRVH